MLRLLSKRIVLSAALLFGAALAFSQVVIEPTLDFYDSARQWQVKGYVSFLPQVSPYPASVVKGILDAVIEGGTEDDAETARYYYEKYFGKKWHVGVEAGAKLKASNGDESFSKFIFFEPSFYGDLVFKDWIALGYNLGLNLHNGATESSELLRLFENEPLNTWGDAATFGSLEGNWDMAAGLNVGTSMINGILGANRIGFANFFGHDSIILNPNSCHMNNFVVNYAAEKFQYSQSISQVAAQNFKGEFTANKFLAFHSIRFTPIKQLAISYFEAGIFGDRFDPSYLIPAPYILLQGMFDAGDNDIYGLAFEYRPFDRFEAALSFAIDDISVDDWGKGNFDSKFKAALQTGVVYTPASKFCKKLSLDYTLVLPYMYSHWINSPSNELPVAKETFNYQDFTNHGVCIGSNLPPNSDRVHFEISFEPVKRLNLNCSTNFIRHGNQTESWTADEAIEHCKKFAAGDNTGGVATDPYPKSVQERMVFMKQSSKMYVFQCGLQANWEALRKKWGVLEFKLGYTFEWIHNKGVDSAIYTEDVANAINAAPTATQKYELVNAAWTSWRDRLFDELNNYISLSVKYSY